MLRPWPVEVKQACSNWAEVAPLHVNHAPIVKIYDPVIKFGTGKKGSRSRWQ